VALIEKTFSDKLNSSEGAFDLLAKFQNVKTREKIKQTFNSKYENVLQTYQRELTQMETLFKEGKKDPPISKNMPPKAGSIAWARSIMGRIKGPIKKFKEKSDQLMTPTFKTVALQYVQLAKELDKSYEHQIFEQWRTQNTEKAIELLKRHILDKEKVGGRVVYRVQFDPQLKVIIREAKFLDRIGKSIPQTIINIALQENEYMRYVDKLNQLLRGYNTALSNLKDVEKKLLEKQITKLNKWMDKGNNNHNWFSLSINEYIKECQQAIDSFIEIKNRVIQKAKNIEEKVLNIENAQLIRQIDMKRKSPMDISEFSEFFESYRSKQLASLVKDYHNIGDLYLKHIQESTVKITEKEKHVPIPEMQKYYEYWERRIFNAITKMTVRALAANKTLFNRKNKPYLIKMTSSYNHPEITFHPTQEELRTTLQKFSQNILESTKSFGRWWRGFCSVFEERVNEENAEKYIPYTFYDDVMHNGMII
jgi:dynein heavy chain